MNEDYELWLANDKEVILLFVTCFVITAFFKSEMGAQWCRISATAHHRYFRYTLPGDANQGSAIYKQICCTEHFT